MKGQCQSESMGFMWDGWCCWDIHVYYGWSRLLRWFPVEIFMDSGYIMDKVDCFKTLILLRASASPKKSWRNVNGNQSEFAQCFVLCNFSGTMIAIAFFCCFLLGLLRVLGLSIIRWYFRKVCLVNPKSNQYNSTILLLSNPPFSEGNIFCLRWISKFRKHKMVVCDPSDSDHEVDDGSCPHPCQSWSWVSCCLQSPLVGEMASPLRRSMSHDGSCLGPQGEVLRGMCGRMQVKRILYTVLPIRCNQQMLIDTLFPGK